jgi:hypothetical protein
MSQDKHSKPSLEARLEALEFAAALGLLSHANGWYDSSWSAENLLEKLQERAEPRGVKLPAGEGRVALQHIVNIAGDMLKYNPHANPKV